MKEYVYEQLKMMMTEQAATVLQAVVRGHLARKLHERLKVCFSQTSVLLLPAQDVQELYSNQFRKTLVVQSNQPYIKNLLLIHLAS